MYLNIGKDLKPEERLWRYMSLAKYISLLEKQSLWLARADTFRDKHEGRFPDEMRKSMEKAYEAFADNDPKIKDAADFQDHLVKNTYLSCWHKNLDENVVMWEIYGQRNDAVAIQTTVGALRDHIDYSGLSGNFLTLDNILYQIYDQIEGVLRYERCFFLKRPHFKFEDEVRLSLDTYSIDKPIKNTPKGYTLPIRLNNLLHGVLVHPDSSDWFLKAVSSVTGKYGLKVEVCRGSHGNL